jgi:putative oxidoreductase
LFIPSMRVTGLYASVLLISIFTIYLGYMIFFIPALPCSCGGVLRYLSWQQHVVFNLFFILLAVAGIYLYKKNTQHFRTPP